MKTIKIIKVSVGALCVSAYLMTSAVNAGKLYKWVDAKGNVSYQDQPPPKGSKILSEKDVKSTSTIRAEKQLSQNSALPKITIYTVENCKECEQFITLMRKNRIPHIELPLQEDREAQDKILSKTGSLVAPTVLIGEQIFQKKSINDFHATLAKTGYDIEKMETAKPKAEPISNKRPQTLTKPNKNSLAR